MFLCWAGRLWQRRRMRKRWSLVTRGVACHPPPSQASPPGRHRPAPVLAPPLLVPLPPLLFRANGPACDSMAPPFAGLAPQDLKLNLCANIPNQGLDVKVDTSKTTQVICDELSMKGEPLWRRAKPG